MAKLKSMFEAAGDLIGSSNATGPLAGLLDLLDTEKIARKMELETRGANRGARDLPPEKQGTLDEVEQGIVQEISDAWTIQKAQVIGTLKALRQTVEQFNIRAKLAQLGLVASDTQARFTAARQELQGELGRLLEEAIATQDELQAFKQKHRLSRAARQPGSRLIAGMLLILTAGLESVLNGTFFAEGSELGLIGGIGIAIGVSITNIALCFTLGLIPARYINRRFIPAKIIAFVITFTTIVGVLALHLFVAHFRSTSASLGEAAAYEAAVKVITSTPWALTDINSWFLFGLGLVFSVIAFAKGYGWDDPYPGYGAVSRRAKNSAVVYEEAHKDLFDDLDAAKDAAIEEFRVALVNLPMEAQKAEAARNQSTALAQRLSSYEQHLEDVGNSLLSRYRGANRASRSSPVPAHFEEHWRLTPRTDVYSLINATNPITPESMDGVLIEIRALHDGILGRYQDLLLEANPRSPSEVRA